MQLLRLTHWSHFLNEDCSQAELSAAKDLVLEMQPKVRVITSIFGKGYQLCSQFGAYTMDCQSIPIYIQ